MPAAGRVTSERRRLAIWMPRPRWVGVAAVVRAEVAMEVGAGFIDKESDIASLEQTDEIVRRLIRARRTRKALR